MNWLAHVHLASLVGCEPAASLLPDLMNVRTFDHFTPTQARAIALHQAIDRFTDMHQAVLHSKRLITAPYVRFSGVLVDIFYDYCLCQAWQEYSQQPLLEFIQHTHTQIQSAIPDQPEATRLIFQRLIEQNWLGSYSTHAGIELSLARISQRIKRPTDLAPAVEQLRAFEATFNEDFQHFYPELCAYVKAVG
ncbi:MAG: acyl carrier protein phosphodiesterase [Thiolinea sp.]